MKNYTMGKYNGKWAVLQIKTRLWFYIGKGKNVCEKMVKILNREA